MIEVSNLGKYFGETKAVDGLTFTVNKGEVLGFLGANGAGKSTTMKMITGFLEPTFGGAKICGFDILTDSERAKGVIGYLPENAPLYGEMTVIDFLNFISEIRLIKAPAKKVALDRAIELTSLGEVKDKKIEELSKGFKRRVGLAQAILHNPDVLILDEPTDGLDPNQKFEVRKLIKEMSQDKTIILSTHILEEVDAVCSRALIIAKGKLIADGTPDELRAKSQNFGKIKVAFTKIDEQKVLEFKEGAKKISAVRGVEFNSTFAFIDCLKDQAAPFRELIELTDSLSLKISSIQTEQGHLDHVFRDLTTAIES